MPGIRIVLTALAVVACGLTTGPATASGPPGPSVPVLDWSDCGGGFECATARVPLDYDRPAGRTIDLALLRLPAADPARRIGTAFVGGPGSFPGRDLLRAVGAGGFDPRVHERFDLVGVDRRGVGGSTPVRCFATQAEANSFYARYPAYPTNGRELASVDRLNQEYASRCVARNGDLLRHVSSADVARDLDLLRAAVGDARLTYIGYSHSAYVGAIYAHLFPGRVRALTLIAPQYAPSFTAGAPGTVPFGRSKADLSAEKSLREFFRLCAAAGPECAFAGRPGVSAAELAAAYDRLRLQLARTPVEVPGYSGPVGSDDLAAVAANLLFSGSTYPDLGEFLRLVSDQVAGRAVGAVRLVEPGEPYPNYTDGWAAVMCGDLDTPSSVGEQRLAQLRRERVAPRFGGFYAWYEPKCEDWPGPAPDRYTGPWGVSTAAPALVVADTYDVIGWLPGSEGMTRVLKSSVMLTVDGWDHLPIRTSRCADAAMADYLVGGVLPAPGTMCAADAPPFG
jgi:pimeloyl-ACP methyl ester carboxylesterase